MSKAQDAMTYLEIGGALLLGFLTYRAVSKAGQGAAAVANEVKTVITKDLNPASSENIIYSNLPDSAKTALGNLMETIFGKIPSAPVSNNVAPVVAPTQNTDTQAQAETARLVRKANATSASGSSAIGYTDSQQIIQSIPVNFGIIDPSTWK